MPEVMVGVMVAQRSLAGIRHHRGDAVIALVIRPAVPVQEQVPVRPSGRPVVQIPSNERP